MAAFARPRLVLRTLLRLQGCAEVLTAFPRVLVAQENRNFIFKEGNHGTDQCSGTGSEARP